MAPRNVCVEPWSAYTLDVSCSSLSPALNSFGVVIEMPLTTVKGSDDFTAASGFTCLRNSVWNVEDSDWLGPKRRPKGLFCTNVLFASSLQVVPTQLCDRRNSRSSHS